MSTISLQSVYGRVQADSAVDIKICKLAVYQTYDSIQAAADWLKRDTGDVEEVSSQSQVGSDASADAS